MSSTPSISARRRTRCFGALDRHPFGRRRIRLDRLGLPRRAQSVLLVAQLVQRIIDLAGSRRIGSISTSRVGGGAADGAPPAALDVAERVGR